MKTLSMFSSILNAGSVPELFNITFIDAAWLIFRVVKSLTNIPKLTFFTLTTLTFTLFVHSTPESLNTLILAV